MTITCPSHMVMYLLPMMLGRTFDMQSNKAGIDIFEKTVVQGAHTTPYRTDEVQSDYVTITKNSEKRDFLGINGALALKISSGMIEVKGAGEYLRDVSNSNNSVEILVRLRFTTTLEKIEEDNTPMTGWHTKPKDLLGTHVVTSVLYGGEVYASVKFIAHESKDLEKIKGAVNVAFSKPEAFEVNATGEIEKVANNVSSMAKMEIEYFANVPLKSVPSTLAGLKELVAGFSGQVRDLYDDGWEGVAMCVELTPLSEYNSGFQFNRHPSLDATIMEDFNHKFDNLREAKTALKEFIATLPYTYPKKNMIKLTEFSNILTSVLKEFYKAIGELDLQGDSSQLDNAKKAFKNSIPHEQDFSDNNRYTTKLNTLKEELAPDVDTTSPRGVYVRWGKRKCGQRKSDVLYHGYIASFPERGIGGGTLYQCIPEDPQLQVSGIRTRKGVTGRESTLSAVRYHNLWMYPKSGKPLENKIAACSLCQSLMRPTVRMFPAAGKCPGDGDWTLEYKGFLSSTYRSRSKTEFICLDGEPDINKPIPPPAPTEEQSYITPALLGRIPPGFTPLTWQDDASVPCVVCSK